MKCGTMAPVITLVAFLIAPAAATALVQQDALSVISADPAKPEEIREKWDKMDDFLEVMFTMACSWKHGKDIAGHAAEKLKNGEVEGADGYHSAVKDMQTKNVKGLEKACGLIVASQKKKCRQSCATRWNAKAGERDNCDEKCVTVYTNFEKSCINKADNLEKVYEQKNTKASGQKQCYEGHCKEFPMVWMKSEEADMKAEVEEQCKSRCTDENVKAGCQKKWALEVDFIASGIRADCAEKSGVKECFNKKKTGISSDYDACQSKTKGECDKAYTECTKKGEVDKTFKDAKAFCDDRKKLCQKQADEKCLSENKAALNKAEKACKKEAGKEFSTCESEGLKKKEDAAEKKCIAERGPKCKGDCEGKCQVEKMNKCLLMYKSQDDPSKMFCKDFWNLLHTSSERDPVSGNPIVLLSKASTLAPLV
jgi:hypothetical protein